MTPLESAITEIVQREVQKALAAQGGFKRPADFRIEAQLSIAEAAKASGVSPATIRRFESGKYRNAREQSDTAFKLANVFGCSGKDYLASVRQQHVLNGGRK